MIEKEHQAPLYVDEQIKNLIDLGLIIEDMSEISALTTAGCTMPNFPKRLNYTKSTATLVLATFESLVF